jgi:hypothetical protein
MKMKVSVEQAKKLYNEAVHFEETGITKDAELRTLAREMFREDTALTLLLTTKEIFKVLAAAYMTAQRE